MHAYDHKDWLTLLKDSSLEIGCVPLVSSCVSQPLFSSRSTRAVIHFVAGLSQSTEIRDLLHFFITVTDKLCKKLLILFLLPSAIYTLQDGNISAPLELNLTLCSDIFSLTFFSALEKTSVWLFSCVHLCFRLLCRRKKNNTNQYINK